MSRQFQTIVHIAGPVDGNLQRCIRCGMVLIDWTGAMSMDGAPMCYWGFGFVGITECVEDGKKLATNPTCSFGMDHDASESDEYPCAMTGGKWVWE